MYDSNMHYERIKIVYNAVVIVLYSVDSGSEMHSVR